MKFKDIYVIVPAFNEQNVIKDIINNLLKNFSNVIVINDGSNDKTLEIINDLDIKILSHEINLGVGRFLLNKDETSTIGQEITSLRPQAAFKGGFSIGKRF